MSAEMIRTIQGKWQFIDPYDQRVLINRFMKAYGGDSSRDDWLIFLAQELKLDERS